jgi:molecular chaperone GrpE
MTFQPFSVLCIVVILFNVSQGFNTRIAQIRSKKSFHSFSSNDNSDVVIENEVTSPTIEKLTRRVKDLMASIEKVQEEQTIKKSELAKLNEEYGGEIERVKSEFKRMKERQIEEAKDIADKAIIDALKEFLPISDDFNRAKSVFDPLESETEYKIYEYYNEVFVNFSNILSKFGVVSVDALGKPFDFNYMEAIMTMPSMEYGPDIVCTQYQVGYKIGERCIRPAIVVVSTGPGPS